MRKTTIAAGLAVALVCLLAAPAGAVDVYLNGVQITGAKDQVGILRMATNDSKLMIFCSLVEKFYLPDFTNQEKYHLSYQLHYYELV